MPSRNAYPALVIDARRTPTTTRVTHPAIPIIRAKTGSEAREAIANRTETYSAIFLNPLLPTYPGGGEVLSLIHRHRPVTPLYFVYSEAPPFGPVELRRLAAQGAIEVPQDQEVHAEIIAPYVYRAKAGQASPLDEEAHEISVDMPIETVDSAFFAVPIEDFLAGAKPVYDIYLRLPSSRYLKIVDAKEPFSIERAHGYAKRGATHFYIKRESHQRCLTYCELLAQQLLRHPFVSQGMRICTVLNQGQQVLQTIRSSGLDERQEDFLYEYVSSLRRILKSPRLHDQAYVRAYLSQLHAYDHAVSTSMISALLALKLKIESETPFTVVALASLLHDIGLYQMPASLQTENESALNEEERKLYRTHPQIGSELVARALPHENAVCRAIAQHHERRDASGFPGLLSADLHNPVAEIIGISDEYVRLLGLKSEGRCENPIQEMRDRVFAGFSFPVIQAFEELFAT